MCTSVPSNLFELYLRYVDRETGAGRLLTPLQISFANQAAARLAVAIFLFDEPTEYQQHTAVNLTPARR